MQPENAKFASKVFGCNIGTCMYKLSCWLLDSLSDCYSTAIFAMFIELKYVSLPIEFLVTTLNAI